LPAHTRTEAPLLLLRVCLRSNLRREPGRWPFVFLLFPGKADSVSPFPARIALQGGERAGADAMYLSTPSTKTCRWGPDYPRKKRATSGTYLAGKPHLARGPTRPMLPEELPIRTLR